MPEPTLEQMEGARIGVGLPLPDEVRKALGFAVDECKKAGLEFSLGETCAYWNLVAVLAFHLKSDA